jgi:hypothetical protein
MKTIITAALAAFIALSMYATRSDAAEFNAIGRSCVPTDYSFQNQVHYSSFGGPVEVQWNGTKTGTLTLYCGIPVDVPNPTHLYLAYRNNTACVGCSSDTIRISYMKMHKTTGVVSTVYTYTTLGATNNGTFQYIESPFSDAWDISNYVYFIKIEMQRASSNNDQRFIAANIWG